MVNFTLSAAEKDALTDGAVVFLGTLTTAGAVSVVDPHVGLTISAGLVLAAFVAGAIAGLNRYRRVSGLPPAA